MSGSDSSGWHGHRHWKQQRDRRGGADTGKQTRDRTEDDSEEDDEQQRR